MIWAVSEAPEGLSQWMVIAAFIVGIVLLFGKAYRFFVPSPPEWKGHYENLKQEQKSDKAELRKEIEDKTNQLHGRVSGLRNEIRGDLDDTKEAVNSGVKEMTDMMMKQTEIIGNMRGHLDANTQQLHSTQQQLQRHIEKPH